MIGLHAAVLASYKRIVSMKDLKQVFEDMEDTRRKNFLKAQALDLIRKNFMKELRDTVSKPA